MPVFNSNHHDRMQCNNTCPPDNSDGGQAFDMHSLGTNLFPFSKAAIKPSQGFSFVPIGVSVDQPSSSLVTDSSITSPIVSIEQRLRTSSSLRKKSPSRHLSTPIKRRREPIICDSESESGGSDSDQSTNGTDRSILIASALFKRRLNATGDGPAPERVESREPLRCSQPDFRVYAVLHSALRLEAERATTAQSNSARVPLHLSSSPCAGGIGHVRRNSSDLHAHQSPAKLARLRATPLSTSWSDIARAAAATPPPPSQLSARVEQLGETCGGPTPLHAAALRQLQPPLAATRAFCSSSLAAALPTATGLPSESSSMRPSFEIGDANSDVDL